MEVDAAETVSAPGAGKKGSKRDRAAGASDEDAAPVKRSKEAHAPVADGDGDVGMHDAGGHSGGRGA